MKKEAILKVFGTGQVTLPKQWRGQLKTPYVRAKMTDRAVLITPLNDENYLGVPEVSEALHEPGFTTIIDAKKLGYKRGIPINAFIKALDTVIAESHEQDRKTSKKTAF